MPLLTSLGEPGVRDPPSKTTASPAMTPGREGGRKTGQTPQPPEEITLGDSRCVYSDGCGGPQRGT